MNYFITGTDTGVGKTVFSTLLALKLGYHYWKPIQSGLDTITDSQWVAKRIGPNSVYEEAYKLKLPLSPHSAAKIDNAHIDLEKILSLLPPKNTIIEGCGGLLVPINENNFIIDLIKKMRASVILVARSELGTINHTLLSIEALRHRDINLLGVVLVGPKNKLNLESIEHFASVPVICEIPIIRDINESALKNISATIPINL